MTRALERAGPARLWGLRPQGLPLPAEDWERRHGAIAAIALAHVPGVLLYAVIMGFGVPHAILETLPVAGFALLGRRPGSTRWLRETTTTLSLVTASAVLVHLSGGTIELHFHFLVVVGLVTLYQQWIPFLLAIAYVGIHHGVAGVIDPSAVYNHPAAIARPWAWAGVHAAFITMASSVGMANWRLNAWSSWSRACSRRSGRWGGTGGSCHAGTVVAASVESSLEARSRAPARCRSTWHRACGCRSRSMQRRSRWAIWWATR